MTLQKREKSCEVEKLHACKHGIIHLKNITEN